MSVFSLAPAHGRVLDPDQWYPVSARIDLARREAAAALAVCAACPVRKQCLELSLRQWYIGRHGIWGGLLAAEREELRARDPDRDMDLVRNWVRPRRAIVRVRRLS